MDDSDEDQRLPHHKEPKEFVSLQQLEGLLYEMVLSIIETQMGILLPI